MINRHIEIVIYVIVIAILCTLYMDCNRMAQQGYGYPGYRGYHHHHSFFYVRRYDHSYYMSNRESSVGGNNFSKRGLSGGK